MLIFLGIMMFIFFAFFHAEKNSEKATLYSWMILADIFALVAYALLR